ncbi:MAG TPA: hypothetical protein DCZ92_05990 [Elusimicrobia bacterium]|nr:MAG: hypothetical protein A2016_07185 [Elusimicrobia bacterium GWF2_62_30]HBA60355.1 hypothetical protein [Elusimicrobiota bacterium]
MRTISPTGRRARTALFLLLAPLAVLACSATLRAQTPEQERAFDYTPANGEETRLQPLKPTVETVMDEEVVVRNDPREGVVITSKNRWKSWLERTLYITLLNIAIAAILASLPKNDEYSLIISYFVSGISLVLSFWIFLCAILLFTLKSASGLYALPVSAVMGAVTYYLLMRIKRADVSLSELKDSFKNSAGGSGSDQRLASIDGAPGDWQEQDFMK